MIQVLKTPFEELRHLTLSIRMSDEEKADIQKKADRYSNGNLSEYMRCASVYYTPRREHLNKAI